MRVIPPMSADPGRNRRFGAGATRRAGASSTSGGASGTAMAGVGSPEGSTTADPGQIYIQTDTSRIWKKITGTGNTGWEPDLKSTVDAGDPNGAVVGRPGDLFYSTDLLQRYVKGSGVETNTGWV